MTLLYGLSPKTRINGIGQVPGTSGCPTKWTVQTIVSRIKQTRFPQRLEQTRNVPFDKNPPWVVSNLLKAKGYVKRKNPSQFRNVRFLPK